MESKLNAVPYKTHLLLLFIIINLKTVAYSHGVPCNELLSPKCLCGLAPYLDEILYIVNCSDTQFTNAKPLQHLPEETEVLIFTGNKLHELPWNVFGTLRNYTKLRIVDMSNNEIREIPGKSYHHVTNVERLILNYNQISISDDDRVNHHHPRVFSNFLNLRELHLTKAFAENSKNLAADLHDIFVNSNLTKLIKLHLEQNKIEDFKDREVFCDLPQIMDLYLANNLLTSVDLELGCMEHLRFIDLEGNKIKHLSDEDLKRLDAVAVTQKPFIIDISRNPLACGDNFDRLTDWIKTTNVSVRNADHLKCIHSANLTFENYLETYDSENQLNEFALATVLGLLTALLIVFAAIFVFNKRKSIRYRIRPIADSISKRVYYSSIGHSDDQEVAV